MEAHPMMLNSSHFAFVMCPVLLMCASCLPAAQTNQLAQHEHDAIRALFILLSSLELQVLPTLATAPRPTTWAI